MTGSPISDMLPILMATKVELEVQHKKTGLRTVILDGHFFTGIELYSSVSRLGC